MRVRLDADYSSSYMPHVPAGEYDADDPIFNGRVSIVLAHGRAFVINETDAEAVTPDADTEKED